MVVDAGRHAAASGSRPGCGTDVTAERMIIVWRRQPGAVLVPDGLDVPGGMAGLPLIQNGRTVAEVEPAELASSRLPSLSSRRHEQCAGSPE